MAKKSISEDYHVLFTRDPLLLFEKNQRAYCDKLLNNILGNRTIATSDPEDLNEESRARFARPKVERPVKPSDAAIAAYRSAHLERIEVPENFRDKLKKITMVSDGSLTRKRFGEYAEHNKAKDALLKIPECSVLEKRLRIAAIGYRVRISKLPGEALLDEDLCFLSPPTDASICETLHEKIGINELGRTCASENSDQQKWSDTVDTYIQHAHSRGSHIIVLPEFALPVANSKMASEVEERLHKLSLDAECDHFLFCGSRHEGGYNRGLIFHKIKGASLEAHWHYKVASARTLGENILGPHHNKVASYTSHVPLKDAPPVHLAVSVALCYDAFDPSTFLSLVHQGLRLRSERWESVIVVPSFNPSEDFVALLRDLSFVTRSVVVYVNSLHGNAKMFICGFAVSDFAENRTFVTKHIQDCLENMHEEQRALQDKIKKMTNRNSRRYSHLKRLLTKLTDRISALQAFQDSLAALNGSHGLDHLITVEHCPDCDEKKPHTELGRCNRDVLYYNIDPRFLNAVRKFREDYISDIYLPTSLRN